MEWLESLLRFDEHLFLQLNSLHTPFWDTVWLFITRKETWLPLYLVLSLTIIRNYGGRSWIILAFMVMGLVVSDQGSGIIKDIVQRYRPGYDPGIRDLTHIVLKKGGEFGFPSSHAANTFYILTFTGYLFRNRYSFLTLLLWALLVSGSRIFVGAHFPLDLVAGCFLGIFTGWLFFRLLTWAASRSHGGKRTFRKKPLTNLSTGLLISVFFTITVTLLIAAYLLHKYNCL